MHRTLPAVLFLAALASAQSVVPPFNTAWQAVVIGQVPNVGSYGGTAIHPASPNTLLVSPWPSTSIDAVPLLRNGAGQIVGTGAATPAISVGGTDGGLAFGPGGVLFGTWFGANNLHQTKPGSTATDRVDSLTSLGLQNSVGACAVVPTGMPGAGRLKVCSWIGAEFRDVPLTPDGAGTYAPGALGPAISLANDVEGMVYAPPGTPSFGGQLLVCEWSYGNIVTYQVDANGDPLPATRQLVVGGAWSPGGGTRDPITGDFVFLGSGGTLLVLRQGATPCGTSTNYGTASPGALGTPTIGATGCARIGETIGIQLGGHANALGLLAAGSYEWNAPWENLTVLQSLDVAIVVVLGPTGSTNVPIAIPANPQLGWAHLYLQFAVLDPSTTSGLSASDGLDLLMR
ncbi:MAG: hypothetical protein JNK15_24580 [Planctomycetes bacterium]|nr:hypothetical protein [Planctomycetota bacterium]